MPSHLYGGLLLGVFLLGGALSEERYSEALAVRRVRVDSGDLETLRLLVPADAFLKSRSCLRICARTRETREGIPTVFEMNSSAPASREADSYGSPVMAVNIRMGTATCMARSWRTSLTPFPVVGWALRSERRLNSSRIASNCVLRVERRAVSRV